MIHHDFTIDHTSYAYNHCVDRSDILHQKGQEFSDKKQSN